MDNVIIYILCGCNVYGCLMFCTYVQVKRPWASGKALYK